MVEWALIWMEFEIALLLENNHLRFINLLNSTYKRWKVEITAICANVSEIKWDLFQNKIFTTVTNHAQSLKFLRVHALRYLERPTWNVLATTWVNWGVLTYILQSYIGSIKNFLHHINSVEVAAAIEVCF